MGKIIDKKPEEKKIKLDWLIAIVSGLIQFASVIYYISLLYSDIEHLKKEDEKKSTQIEELKGKSLSDSPSIVRLQKDIYYLRKEFEEYKNKKEK